MMTKTIAQMALMNWIEFNVGVTNMNIQFMYAREAFVTDEHGDTMTLKYDSDTREVYAI